MVIKKAFVQHHLLAKKKSEAKIKTSKYFLHAEKICLYLALYLFTHLFFATVLDTLNFKKGNRSLNLHVEVYIYYLDIRFKSVNFINRTSTHLTSSTF